MQENSAKLLENHTVDQLEVRVYADRSSMGHAAGTTAADELRTVLTRQGEARMIFAAAPSQDECLETLCNAPDIDWNKVTAFHMDEYIGLASGAPQRFANYLKKHLFDRLPFKTVHFLDDSDPSTICSRYTDLLSEKPIDIVCLGVGENGHIAFNDPPVADFSDPKLVKIVDLDLACRQQQVNDGCFASLGEVPLQAITLTIPALLSGKKLICTVPGKRKIAAVRQMLEGEITTDCPAGILRQHGNTTLFIDRDCWTH